MKTLKLAVGIILLSMIVWSCKNEAEQKIETSEIAETKALNKMDADANMAKAEFKIEGMTCAIGCAKKIEKNLSKIEGVKSAAVDFDKKMAMVAYDDAIVNTNSLEETVTKTGEQYTVSEMKTVESFTTDGAKKACDKDCKKACCAGKDKKECKTKCSADCTDKDCSKCAALKAECKKKCDAKKASCKAASKCSPDCTKKDCPKCVAKKAECKKKCDAKKKCDGKKKNNSKKA